MGKRQNDRFQELLDALPDRVLDDGQFDELARLVAADVDAMERYLHASHMDSCLAEFVDEGLRDSNNREIARRLELLATGQASASIDSGHGEASRSELRQWPGNIGRMVLAVAAMAAVVVVGGYMASKWWQDDRHVVDDAGIQGGDEQGGAEAEVGDAFVAQLVDVSRDTVWRDDAAPPDLFLRLEAEVPLIIERGVIKVAFGDGATLFLHGPARLTPLSTRSARLDSGRVLGHAEDGNFELKTPAANVIDYGTEFGVNVASSLETEVCVFDGEVGVSAIDGSTSDVQELRLRRGMAVRIREDGTLARAARIDRDAYAMHADAFQSNLLPAHQLSLMSVLANSPPGENPIAIAIDPRDGNWDPRIPRDDRGRYRPSDCKYHPSQTSPVVDGVFIPHAAGDRVVVNSAGDTFDFGANDGMTWGPIWGRRRATGMSTAGVFRGVVDEYWGKDTRDTMAQAVDNSNCGVIGLHPNVGISIDLLALRLKHDADPDRLTARLANLDNFEATENRPHPKWSTRSADVRVIVDGLLRFERLNLQRADGNVELDVTLDRDDRFLTLVSTDAGNSNWFDHVVLIDAVIHLNASD